MVRTASIGLSFSSRTRLMQTKRRTFSSRSQNTSSSEGATTAFQTYTTLAAAAGTITRPVLTFGSSVYLLIGALPFFFPGWPKLKLSILKRLCSQRIYRIYRRHPHQRRRLRGRQYVTSRSRHVAQPLIVRSGSHGPSCRHENLSSGFLHRVWRVVAHILRALHGIPPTWLLPAVQGGRSLRG